MINGAQTMVASYKYDPFGRIESQSGSLATDNVYRFSSKEALFKTTFAGGPSDLYYYGFRFYDAQTGRWLNRDPIQERGGYNLYRFLRNPINKVDPWGLDDADREFEERANRRANPPPSTDRCKTKVCFGPMSQQEANGWTRYFSSNEDVLEAGISACVGFGCNRLGVPATPSVIIGFLTDLAMAGYDGPIFRPGDVLCFESTIEPDPYRDSGINVIDSTITINGGPLKR